MNTMPPSPPGRPAGETSSLQPLAISHQPSPGRLPLLTTYEQAEAIAIHHNDVFYATAFFIQHWLQDLLDRAVAQYEEHKNPKDRSLQRGEAWRALQNLFEDILRKRGHECLLSYLYRFALSDNSSLLRRSPGLRPK